MNYEEFMREAVERRLRLSNAKPSGRRRAQPLLSNEALFQLPFLAMVILAISKGQRKPALSELGQLVGECIERSIAGFRSSPQQIGWSANLRIRTVKALTFLETSELAKVHVRSRSVIATEKGRMVFDRAVDGDGPLSQTLLLVERSYRNLTAEAQIRLEV